MLKIATYLDNPGEPLPATRYRDANRLRDLGYNGLVLYKTVGLSGISSPDAAGEGEMQRWLQHHFDLVDHSIQDAAHAGLAVYLAYDVLSLPRAAVLRDAGILTCKRRPDVLCPASEAALERSASALEALLHRWPRVAGVVLRFGDSDAARLRYVVGNDIYSPHCARCGDLSRADRIARVIERFHGLVVDRLDKRLIVRAWNVRPGGMHDSPNLCEELAPRLPGPADDDRLVLSFKFSETDFWRYQRWNPCSELFPGRHVIYELQCQREFEGKGGVPNWQAPLWRDGFPESGKDGQPGGGLAEAAKRVNLAGVWAWVRGGGWGGPFVQNESWIDANVAAAPALAEDPQADLQTLADQWITKHLGLAEPVEVAAVRHVLTQSPSIILRGFYIGPFARTRRDGWHPNGDWIQDDLLDAEAAWRMVQRVPEASLDDIVREKDMAVDQLSQDQQVLYKAINKHNRSTLEPLLNTLIYEEMLFKALRDLLAGLVAYRRFLKHKDPAHAEQCRQRLFAAQSHWNHHTQRAGALPGVATAFREAHFWELTQQILGEVSDPGMAA